MEKVTAGMDQPGTFAPEFAELNDEALTRYVRHFIWRNKYGIRPYKPAPFLFSRKALATAK